MKSRKKSDTAHTVPNSRINQKYMADRILNGQQEKFLSYYTDPKSESFANARQSCLRAGYSAEYAENIMALMPDWLSESIGDMKMLRKAEKRLNQILELEAVDEEGKIDNALLANQMKAITLVAKGLGKSKYSERTELTGKDGKELPTPIIALDVIQRDDSTKEDSAS